MGFNPAFKGLKFQIIAFDYSQAWLTAEVNWFIHGAEVRTRGKQTLPALNSFQKDNCLNFPTPVFSPEKCQVFGISRGPELTCLWAGLCLLSVYLHTYAN
jgi:hypothetical protein